MEARKWVSTHIFQMITVLLITVVCIAALILTTWIPRAGHAADKQAVSPHVNSVLQWPFAPSSGSWFVESGYNDSQSPDHNCNSPNCYERYGLDLQASGGTGGKVVYGPATSTGRVYVWNAYNNEGLCFTFSLGNSTYVMVCHVDFFGGVNPTSIKQGVPVGTVNAAANHIHINIFTSTSFNLAVRTPVPFSGPWTIGGCDYPNDPTNQLTVGGQYGGSTVPCANQSTTSLTFHWGNPNSSAWSGMNLNRSVFVEVRSSLTGSDLFSQSVTTDSTGTATLALTKIVPGTYYILIKPRGFLRQSQLVALAAGTNILTYSMMQSGTQCNNGQPTGPQLWAGDVNGDNVINTDDYSLIVTYFGKAVPSGLSDINGDGVFDGVDYNTWLRAICFFGGGSGAVVGDGGRSDMPVNQIRMQQKQQLHANSSGTISLSPASGSYRVNQSFSVNVQANSSGVPLDGADIVIHYDPTVLSVTSLTAGSAFAYTPVLTNNSALGEINISSIATKGTPVTVSGVLATLQFQVIGSGQTAVTLDFNPNSNAHSNMSANGTSTQALGSVFSASFTAGILTVPQQYSTIAQALAAANPGETVLVSPGTYHELLSVPASVILKGQNVMKTIIDGSSTNNTAVVYLGNNAQISNLTIKHSGTSFWDAAIWADQGPVSVTNMRIMNSSMGIVRYCWSPPCNDTSIITNNLVAHNITTGILIHGAQAQVRYNTVDHNKLQGITFEATGGQGDSIANIVTSSKTGLTATSATLLMRNLLWQNGTTYGSGTIAGSTDVLANPLYVNATGNNYNLHAVSAAVDADGSLGAYPFTAVGNTPTALSETQSGSQVTLSWNGSGATGYYVFVDQGTGFFSQVIDAKTATTYTFSSLAAGTVRFAVVGYKASKQESLAVYLTTTITGTSAPVKTSPPISTPVPSFTPTPCPIGGGGRRVC